MFKRLYEICDNVKALNYSKLVFFVFSDSKVQKIIIDLNRIDQLLYNGELPDGSLLPLYKNSYGLVSFEGKSVTKEKGQPYTLFDSGDYYRSFKVVPNPSGFIITANDEKENGTLEEMYTDNKKILGLTNENKSKLAKEILPAIQQYIRSEILSKH